MFLLTTMLVGQHRIYLLGAVCPFFSVSVTNIQVGRPPATRTFELEDTSVFSLSQGLVTRDEITASGGKADTILTGTNPFLSSPPTVTFV